LKRRQDKFIASNGCFSTILRDYDKYLKDHAKKLVLKDELDRVEHYAKIIFKKREYKKRTQVFCEKAQTCRITVQKWASRYWKLGFLEAQLAEHK